MKPLRTKRNSFAKRREPEQESSGTHGAERAEGVEEFSRQDEEEVRTEGSAAENQEPVKEPETDTPAETDKQMESPVETVVGEPLRQLSAEGAGAQPQAEDELPGAQPEGETPPDFAPTADTGRDPAGTYQEQPEEFADQAEETAKQPEESPEQLHPLLAGDVESLQLQHDEIKPEPAHSPAAKRKGKKREPGPGNAEQSAQWGDKLENLMRKFQPRRLSLVWKIGGTFAGLSVVLLVIGVVTVVRLQAVQGQNKELANQDEMLIQYANQMQEDILSMESGLRGYIITNDSSSLELSYNAYYQRYPKDVAQLKILEKAEPAMANQLNLAISQGADFVAYTQQLIQLQKQGQTDEVLLNEKGGNAEGELSTIQESLNSVIQQMQKQAQTTSRNLERADMATEIAVFVLIILAILVAVVAGGAVSYATSRNVRRVQKMIADMASAGGDLRKRITGVNSGDEIEDLATSTNALVETIGKLVRAVSQTTETVASSAEELTASTDETTRAISEIASTAGQFAAISEEAQTALTESGAALDGVRASGAAVANQTQAVLSSVDEVVKTTDQGTTLLERSRASMRSIQQVSELTQQRLVELEQSAKRITTIADTIRGIASQTNLLALNASIEAARAGDAGRGFAVVAQEVRHLAEQSHEATQQIQAIVKENAKLTSEVSSSMQEGVQSVTEGKAVMDETGRAFEDIRTAVHQVVPSAEEILVSVQEESRKLQEVLDVIERVQGYMNQVAAGSQQNAASTEESLATAEEISASAQTLSQLAQELFEQVSKFQV